MSTSARRKLILCGVPLLVGLAIGLFATFHERDGHGVAMTAVLVGVVFSVPCVVLGLWLRDDRNNAWPRRPVPWLFAMTLVPLGVLPCVPAASTLEHRDIDEVKRWCEELVPILERYRDSHGAYPEELSAVSAGPGWTPRRLDTVQYFGSGESCSLSLPDPDSFLGLLQLDRASGRWEAVAFPSD